MSNSVLIVKGPAECKLTGPLYFIDILCSCPKGERYLIILDFGSLSGMATQSDARALSRYSENPPQVRLVNSSLALITMFLWISWGKHIWWTGDNVQRYESENECREGGAVSCLLIRIQITCLVDDLAHARLVHASRGHGCDEVCMKKMT